MAALDLAAVMDALAAATQAAGITRFYGWPNGSPNPPAVVVGYPTEVRTGITSGRSNDRATFPVYLIMGKPEDRATRNNVGTFLAGGPGDMVTALNAADVDPSIMSSRVTGYEFETSTSIGGVDYLTVRFDVDVLT